MTDITIQISGKAGSGKTTLALAIHSLLRTIGVDCKVEDDTDVDAIPPQELWNECIRSLREKNIIIKTVLINEKMPCFQQVPPNLFGVFACHSVDGPVDSESLRSILSLNGPIADVQSALEEDRKEVCDISGAQS